jgi:hypothetical protein
MGVSGQRHAPAALYPPGKHPRYSLYRKLGGPRAGLDTEARGKILWPCLESNPDRPVVQPVVRHYTAWANPAPDETSTLYNTLLRSVSYRKLNYSHISRSVDSISTDISSPIESYLHLSRSRGSSVSIVSDYRLDDWSSRFDPRQRQRIFL